MKAANNGIVKGTRREGTLLDVPIARVTKKSRFLKQLERRQAPQVLPKGVTRLRTRAAVKRS